MGIVNPRPAMRAREERGVHAKLAHHAALLKLILNSADGHVDASLASHEAARLTQTRKARKAIWKRRESLTTEQLVEQAIQQVQQMSEAEKARLRERLSGLAHAARKFAAGSCHEEAADHRQDSIKLTSCRKFPRAVTVIDRYRHALCRPNLTVS